MSLSAAKGQIARQACGEIRGLKPPRKGTWIERTRRPAATPTFVWPPNSYIVFCAFNESKIVTRVRPTLTL